MSADHAAAAVATFLLTYATTYPSSCSPRSASASPAARSRSASPMSRAGIRKEKQGTALGIFGAGNVGAAVTKFVAPFVMVAFGWQDVAQVWAARARVMAVIFSSHQGRPGLESAARAR
jgi:NNP family nitrate/nitrite transporter-like MFS transporter